MTIESVVAACEAAGFTGDALTRIVAIAGAESGWRSEATNDTRRFMIPGQWGLWTDPRTGETLPQGQQPEYSCGSFQINLLAHPDVDEEMARDDYAAASYAFELSQGGADFSPWSTNRNLGGAYLALAAAAIQAAHAVEPPPPPAPVEVFLSTDRAVAVLTFAATVVDADDDTWITVTPGGDRITVTTAISIEALSRAWPGLATVLQEAGLT